MADDALPIARLLFWVFAAGVLLLPVRWAFFCFILASHMDITSLSFTSASAVGFENAVRIGGLPGLLLLRTGLAPLRELARTVPQKLWLGLVAYAAIAGSWSGFPLAAAKMTVYLAAYLVLYAIFCEAWANRWIDVGMMRLVAWCVIALAILQTFLLGNAWGGLEERFTSFSSPQYFAAFLVALLAILVFSGERGMFHYATCAALVLNIVLSGSRYVFISAVVLLVIASFRVVTGSGDSLQWKPNFKKIVITLGFAAAGVAVLVSYLPYNRLDELFTNVAAEKTTVQDVGTLGWRLGIYEEIFSRLERRNAAQLLFGSGTSSGAGLMLDIDPTTYSADSIDGNRVLHSEYLRALYEWGILGAGLLFAFLATATVGFTRKMAYEGGGPALAFFGVLPSILIGLAIENVLAGAASAAGVGILLAISFAWQMEAPWLCEAVAAEGFISESPVVPA